MATSPAFELLSTRKVQLEAELEKYEKTVYQLETEYLGAEYSQCGTVLKGFEGFLSSKDALRKRARAFKPEDRLFSLSSKTSIATAELAESQFDMMEIGGVPGTGRGKVLQASKGQAQKGRR